MAEFKLPELGENITSGDVVKVLINAGDKVEKDQIVVELETDKAVVEVPSEVEGVVESVAVKAGDTVSIGQTLFTVGNAIASASKAETKPETKPEPESKPEPKAENPASTPAVQNSAPASRDWNLPELGENITSGDIVKVLVKAGDTVSKDQNVLEIETDKAVVEVPIDIEGTIEAVHVKDGESANVGQHIFTIQSQAPADTNHQPSTIDNNLSTDEPAQKSEPAPVQPAPVVAVPTPPTQTKRPAGHLVLAAPSVRKLAREIGVDINEVKGSGERGRVSIDDVKAHSKRLHSGRQQEMGAAVVQQIPLPDFAKWGPVKREAMSKIRKTTAHRMAQAWSTIPQVTQTDEADVTLLEDLRKKFGKKAEAHGTKLTSTAILLKIVGSALKVFPKFNCSIDMTKHEIIYKDYIHVGVAVDTDRGLLVPSVRDVNDKNILELAKDLGEMAKRARDKKTTLDEMQGSTFTISNLGGIGGGHFTPIVNPPEVAILGVGRYKVQPVLVDGEWVPRKILPLSLTYDHRIIDGADAARFLRWLCEAMEDPFLMDLEG